MGKGLYLAIKDFARSHLSKNSWRMLMELKRISRKPYARIPWRLYCRFKKKRPLPPGALYRASIVVANLDSGFVEGEIEFTGYVVPMQGRQVRTIVVYAQGERLGSCDDFQRVEQRLYFKLRVSSRPLYPVFEFFLELTGNGRDFLGNIELSYLTGMSTYEKDKREINCRIPEPPPEIIFLTQGHRQQEVYLRSSLRGAYILKQILSESGLFLQDMPVILDFGCGSGRLLRGLYSEDSSLRLHGADYNETLIAWAKENFPPDVTFVKNELHPPLPFEDGYFDLVYLVSVFTHLPLESQVKWLAEFKRVLKKGGVLIVSLHGMAYLDYFRGEVPEAYEELLRKGHAGLEVSSGMTPGSNEFYSVHLPEFALGILFKDWTVKSYLPGGRIRSHVVDNDILGFAGVQDIYILSN